MKRNYLLGAALSLAVMCCMSTSAPAFAAGVGADIPSLDSGPDLAGLALDLIVPTIQVAHALPPSTEILPMAGVVTATAAAERVVHRRGHILPPHYSTVSPVAWRTERRPSVPDLRTRKT